MEFIQNDGANVAKLCSFKDEVLPNKNRSFHKKGLHKISSQSISLKKLLFNPNHRQVSEQTDEAFPDAAPSSIQFFTDSEAANVVTDCSLNAEIIQSIGKFYGLLSPSRSGARAFLTLEAATILVSALEFRLRLIIQEAKKFSEFSVASGARNGTLMTYNIISAFDVLKISLNNSPWLKQTTLNISSSNKHFARIPRPTAQALSSLPLDLLPFVLTSGFKNSSEVRSKQHDIDPILKTTDILIEDPEDEQEDVLPQLMIRWAAIDGLIVNDELEYTHEHTSDADSKLDPFHYVLHLRIPDYLNPLSLIDPDNFSSPDLGQQLCSLGIVSQRSKVSHSLSREHILLLNHIRTTLRRPFLKASDEFNESVLQVLKSLRTSSGLSQLLPYLSYFASCQIFAALGFSAPYNRPAAGVRVFIRAMIALVHNTTLQTQFSIHQILQAILFVVLHPTLGITSMPLSESLSLRYFAAKAVSLVTDHFAIHHGGKIYDLVCNLYHEALAKLKQPLPTLLGAVIGARCLGQSAIQHVILPVMPILLKLLQQSFNDCNDFSSSNEENKENLSSQVFVQELSNLKRSFLIELFGCITDVISEKSYKNENTFTYSSKFFETFNLLEELYGDSLLPLTAAGCSRNLQTLDQINDTKDHDDISPDFFSEMMII